MGEEGGAKRETGEGRDADCFMKAGRRGRGARVAGAGRRTWQGVAGLGWWARWMDSGCPLFSHSLSGPSLSTSPLPWRSPAHSGPCTALCSLQWPRYLGRSLRRWGRGGRGGDAEGRGGFAASSTLRDRRLLDRPAPPIRPTLYLQIQQHLPYAEGVVELLARAHSRLPSSSSSLCCPPTRRRSPQAPVRWPRSRRSPAPTLLDSSRSTDASCARRCPLPERRLRPTRNRTRGRPICFTIFALA